MKKGTNNVVVMSLLALRFFFEVVVYQWQPIVGMLTSMAGLYMKFNSLEDDDTNDHFEHILDTMEMGMSFLVL